ncbi:MAG TPA: type VI secretion system baseplate subunit TssF [Steroidobacteraceae bacterium]|nr:type VI secretion system baseplate subunit TssF [Steroidobacteraceae bacterium]
MDPRLLEYYNRELQFVREMGAEFAQAYPRIAARLGMDGIECADPYVERLLEGFAFLAARVQLKIDARHPEFTQHLLQMVYPHFLCPVPACAIAELAPDFKEDALQAGVKIPRGSSLRTQLNKGELTASEFRTAHDVTIWPLDVAEAKYFSGTGALSNLGVAGASQARAAIRLRLKSTAGVVMSSLDVDELTFFIKGTSDIASKIYEQVLADGVGVYARGSQSGASGRLLPASAIKAVGFDEDESLLPSTQKTFEGYRLLQEYFSFPDRFLFFKISGLREAVRSCAGEELDLYVLLDRAQAALDSAIDSKHFRLYCTPIVNLFQKSLDRVHVAEYETEHHVLPDRNRPMDFEVYAIERVGGVGAEEVTSSVEIKPFYAAGHRSHSGDAACYYTVQRRQRLYSTRQQKTGARTSYIGSECYISVVDAREQDAEHGFRQIDVRALCTNRDLPIQTTFGKGRTDLLLDGSAPVESIRCISGPTFPRPSPAFGDTAWKLISHLSLNYLSLRDSGDGGAELLRELLSLYADPNDAIMARQIEGVRKIGYQTVVERVPGRGPISYGRGLKISLDFDDAAFEGTGIVILGAVLERFFARYISLNGFTRTQLRSMDRGEIKTWPIRLGTRPIL